MIIKSMALDNKFQTLIKSLQNILLGMTIQFILLYLLLSDKLFEQLVFPFLTEDKPPNRNYFLVSMINIPEENVLNRLYVKLIDDLYIKLNSNNLIFLKVLALYETLLLHRVTFLTHPIDEDIFK